jgi:hypothetical protein
VSQPLRSGNTMPGSVLRDGAITLDLRRPPTRADLGLIEGRNERAYQQEPGEAPIAVTVELPTGTLALPAFVVSAGGNDHTPAGTRNPRPPERIVVERTFADAAAARRSLAADSALLGLDRAERELLLSRVAAGRPPALPQQGNLTGLVRAWLAVSVDVIGHEDSTVQVNYTFTSNEYRNPVVDAVVRDGVFAIDLTRRPSRADLAFRDGYSLAEVRPAPRAELMARLTLPGGTLERAAASVTSTTTGASAADPAGTGEPRQTAVWLPATGTDQAARTLRADAALLGLDEAAARAIFAGAPGTHVKATLPGRSTQVYDVSAQLELTLGQPGPFAASISYRFDYR